MKHSTILRHTLTLLVALLTLATVSAHAERPKVGLVLGGGGARGAAHIGVLRELERQRIPVDAVVGTSMGAIVGGLYASGKTPDELEHIVATLDWADAMTDTPSREYLSFRRKLDDERYPISLELGLREGGLVLPMGAVEGQRLSLILRELTIDATGITDFDDLPIPFRAVATDVGSGEAHVMSDGDLATAIRASMSVPAIFAPVERDGKLLVDGGIAANLPVSIMREMGVDIIIAVDVEFPLYPAEDLVSAVTISEQILTILMRRETQRQIASMDEADILIQPELGTFDSGDFARSPETIPLGVDAAIAAKDRLAALSLDQASFDEHVAARGKPAAMNEDLAFVRVATRGRVSPDILEAHVDIPLGNPIDTAALANAAEDMYGMNIHEQVSYRLVEENGETGVEFVARDKSYGPNIFKFAINLENDFEGSTSFNVGARLARTGINARGAEWQTDLQLGTEPQLLSEFYQPVHVDSPWFFAPRIELEQWNLNAFVGADAVARYRVSEYEVGLDGGLLMGTVGELRMGLYNGTGRARVKIGDPALQTVDFDTGGALTRLRFDTRDDAQFPRSGIRADLLWNLSLPDLGADERFDTVEADIEGTWSRGKNSYQVGAYYGTTLESKNAIQDLFRLGGFLRLSGLERGEISGPHAAMVRLLYYRQVSSSTGGIFEVPIYLGASMELGNTWQTRSDISASSALFNGGVFAGFDTAIGPVYLGAGFAEGGRSNYYLFFGSPRRW